VTQQRVQKFLARAGVASRRNSEELIAKGEVTVNGVIIGLGASVGPGDIVSVSGQIIGEREAHVTYMLHKPSGVVSTVKDNRRRTTVMDLVPHVAGLHPVGRLDADTEGLILLSTDGELTFALTHPKHGTPKVYRVWLLEGGAGTDVQRRLLEGVMIDDGIATADAVEIVPGGCVITIHDGRNRQVRKMLAVTGNTVSRLVRLRIGNLLLGDLPVGSFRVLEKADLEATGYKYE
jgi:23S rRNA pseudouridine2605 synthase